MMILISALLVSSSVLLVLTAWRAYRALMQHLDVYELVRGGTRPDLEEGSMAPVRTFLLNVALMMLHFLVVFLASVYILLHLEGKV